MGCIHLEVSIKSYTTDNGFSDENRTCKAFYCRAYDKYMYTYRKRYLAERKGIEVYDDERVETFQCEEMPAEATGGCEKYKNYVLARLK